jgi:hypothetical protein
MFFSKDATCCEDVNNVFYVLSRNVKCDRNMRFQIFFLAEIFLWNRSRDHAWSFHRLCFDCLTRVFSRWLMLNENDSSNLDENDSLNMNDISLILISDVSSNLTKCISSNLINNISSNLMTIFHQTWWITSQQVWWLYLIKFWRAISHQTWWWYLIKFDDDISSNSTKILFVFLWWAFLSDKRKFVNKI